MADMDTDDRRTLIWFEHLRRGDVALVGGKNASLGEMVQSLDASRIRVPPGFATTSSAYRAFIAANGFGAVLREELAALGEGRKTLAQAGRAIRETLATGAFPPQIEADILDAYRELGRRTGRENPSVAVRSSATAEDLPDASFAGQQETFLNVEGERALLMACRRCYASLFTDRAITYR
ncbi:PEP/pyruvate-binding domain-containing protein, partial [Mameliella sp. AT18]